MSVGTGGFMQALNGGPLPVVDDRYPWQSLYQAQNVGPPAMSPWQQALAGKQDQGAGELMQGPWSDNTPVQGGGGLAWLGNQRPLGPSGAPNPSAPGQGPGGAVQSSGTFGTTFKDPGGGWNPWSLYDGREGYDGTAVDGWYNAAADSKKGWGPNGTPESDRDRVWRMTLADLGPNPGGQPPEKVKAAFLNNVARLKRDYMDTRGLGAQAWANSAFSGYDRLPGTQGGAAATSGPAAGRGTPTPGQQGQQGGTGMADPGAAARAAAEAAGRAAAQAAQGAGLGQQPSSLFNNTTSPNGGESHPGGGTYGKFTTPDIESVLAEIQADPGKAALIWRAMQGQTKPALGRMAGTRDSLYGQALQAALGTAGLPGMGSLTDVLSNFNTTVSQPGGLSGLGNQLAGKLGGMDLGALTSLDLDKLLSTVAALKGINMGKLGKSAMGTQLQNVQEQDWLRQAQGGMQGDDRNYASDLTDTDYGRALMQYLGAQ